MAIVIKLNTELIEDYGEYINIDIDVKRITIKSRDLVFFWSCYMLDSLYQILLQICEYDDVIDILEYVIGECEYLYDYHNERNGFVAEIKVIEVKPVVTQLSLF